MKQRPLEIKAFGALYLVVNLLLFSYASWAGDPFTLDSSYSWFLLIMLGSAILGAVAGAGVIMLRKWARWLILFLAMLWVVGLATIILTNWSSGVSQIRLIHSLTLPVVGLAWNSLILLYFLRPGVKAQFVKVGKSSSRRTDG